MAITSEVAGWKDTPAADLDIGHPGGRVLQENDRVRIWETVLEPGEELPLHRHDLDFINISLAGDRIAGYIHPEARSMFTEDLEGDVVPGSVLFVQRGGIEIAKNTGKEQYRAILIELKD